MKTTYGRKRDKGRAAHKKENCLRQLVQLLVCLALFLVVFIGKEVWPSKVAETGRQLLSVIRTNTDFRGAFANLGQALSKEDSVLGEIGEFCVSVFAPTREKNGETAPEEKVEKKPAYDPEVSGTDAAESPEPVSFEPEMQVGDVIARIERQGIDLPDGYSEQWLYLGELETVTPVHGIVSSMFGYRDHPTIGRYAVHGGVDIAADRGTTVSAFAAGTVSAVGNSEDFGLWLQMEHANGVTTFYAHCNQILVKSGEYIEAGESVACVGSTGKSTGPHLHFEIRLNGVRLDPMHYIELSDTL